MNKSNGIVQAKEEYTKELINILTEPMCCKFLTIYENVSKNSKNKREVIINYQRSLQEIPLWNQGIINTEVSKIQEKCEFLDDLVAAIFVTNVKILSSIKMGKEKQKIQVTMPKTDQFIHKIYTNAAQTLYDNPYIFSNQYDGQKRKSEIILFVQNSIENTIRTNLPFRNILQNYLGNTVNESDSDDSDNESKEEEPEEVEEPIESEEPTEPLESEEPTEPLESEEPTEPLESEELQTPQQNLDEVSQPSQGFFDRPIEQQTIPFEKTVTIQNPPQNLQMQEPIEANKPMLFSDAANDPES
jgi:hypothetical protein